MPDTSPAPYGGRPPYVKSSQTSAEAADSIENRLGNLQKKVLAYVQGRGEYGATQAEVKSGCDLSDNTTHPRVRELELKGLLVKTERRRPTPTGRTAFVYVAASLEK